MNSTVGCCPKCGKTELRYEVAEIVDSGVKYPFTCETCGYQGLEWYKLVFDVCTDNKGNDIQRKMNVGKLIAFDEPHFSGGNCHVTMTKEQAIKWYKKTYEKKNLIISDKQALKECMAIHWAYWD